MTSVILASTAAKNAVRLLSLTLIVAATLLFSADDGHAQRVRIVDEVGNWQIRFAERRGVGFCSLNVNFRNGDSLFVDRIEGRNGYFITYYSDDMRRVRTGRRFDVTVFFSGGRTYDVRGREVYLRNSRRVGVEVRASRRMIRSFQRARNIEFSYRGFSHRPLNLNTSSRAVNRLDRCARRYF